MGIYNQISQGTMTTWSKQFCNIFFLLPLFIYFFIQSPENIKLKLKTFEVLATISLLKAHFHACYNNYETIRFKVFLYERCLIYLFISWLNFITSVFFIYFLFPEGDSLH